VLVGNTRAEGLMPLEKLLPSHILVPGK